ncbi:MAG: hypothetical protein ACE5GQ_04920 [Nitrospinales bacterium]
MASQRFGFSYAIWRKALLLLIIGVLGFQISGILPMFASPISAEAAGNPLIRIGKIAPGLHGIIIRAKNVPLARLLGELDAKSGINIQISQKLNNQSISIDLKEPSWSLAVLKILENYNHVVVWGKYQLKSAYLFDTLDTSEKNHLAAKSIPENRSGSSQVSLSKAKLRQLALGPIRGPLPQKLLEDYQFRQFLAKNNVRFLEDLTNIQKVMKVRSEARKQLQLLNKQSNTKKRAR